MISQLQTGVLSYEKSGRTFQLHVSGGFVEVNDDRISVLAEIAELPAEIDAARDPLDRCDVDVAKDVGLDFRLAALLKEDH